MSSKTKKLGALADIYQREHLDGAITKLKIKKIYPSLNQPRGDRTKNVAELAASIKQDGLLFPIVVTKEDQGYRIIAGERRFHAAKSLGWEEIECRIISREIRDYKRIALVENLQRENLSAIEEAVALLELKKQEDLSDADLGKTIGKSRNYVTEILGIAALPEEVAMACSKAGILSKNILIQAVQSWKKGQVDEFIEAYKSNQIKTVKEAKVYNKSTSKSTQPAKKGSPLASARIDLNKNRILIEFDDADLARSAYQTLIKLKNR